MMAPHLLPGAREPRVCVPVVAADTGEMLRQAAAIRAHEPPPDVVEWRADYLRGLAPGALPEILRQVWQVLSDIPILFTLRRREEGGASNISEPDRLACIGAAIHSGHIALVDIELATAADARADVIAQAHAVGVGVIVSAHDFGGTPDAAALAASFAALCAAGGDAAKLAVTAQTPDDALRLLRVTARAAATASIPLISMAMGPAGPITRLAGPLFGSAMTFATIGPSSAPGQLPLALVRDYWRHAGIRH
jgi:3-dehydroquinate dehydratase-1